VHEEVIGSVFHALIGNGIEPTAFLNDRILGRGDIFSRFTEYGDRVNYRPLDAREDWHALADEVREFDLLVFNTFRRDGQASWARGLGLPLLGVVHNPKLIVDQAECRDMVRKGEARLLTLAPHATSWLMAEGPHLFGDTATMTAWMWDMPEGDEPSPGERRRITIPGAVDFRNRDYSLVLEALPGLLDEVGRDEIEIAIVGGGKDRAELQRMVADRGLDDVFSFAPVDEESGYVLSDVFYSELARSSFLLPLLPEGRRDYRTWKITAAVSSSIGFKVPAILDRWTATVYNLPCVSYPAGRSIEGLAAALRMPEEELTELHGRLSAHRAAAIERNVEEMGYALQSLYDGRETPSPAPAPAAPAPAAEAAPQKAAAPQKIEPGAVVLPGPEGREDREAFLAFARNLLPHSYSQRFQDIWALWETGFGRQGYFVEFGALNGKDFSNTYLLEQLGWSGVVAEPHPAYAAAVRQNRTCTISTKCVFDATGETVTFHAVQGRPALSSIAGFGTEDARSHLRERYIAHDVETVTLGDLLAESGAPKEIDFLSIDTEGSELRILNAFDFDSYRIACISVEHNDHQREALHTLLTSKGYRRKWEDLSGHDDWYVLETAYPDWSADGMASALGGAQVVEPFVRAYDERRRLLGKFLGSEVPALPAEFQEVPVKKAAAKAKPKRLRVDATYAFTTNFDSALETWTELPPEVVARRAELAFRRICRVLEPTVSLEVGAGDASYSRWLRDKLPECRTIAFEADPVAHQRNSAAVSAAGVDYVHAALAEVAGTVKVEVGGDEHELVEVPSLRLDDACPEAAAERVVVRLDGGDRVEQVIEGGTQLLSSALVVQAVVGTDRAEGRWSETDVSRHFTDSGYVLLLRHVTGPGQAVLVFARGDVARQAWVARKAARVYRPVGQD
jgi:FkbM family methyltransferase